MLVKAMTTSPFLEVVEEEEYHRWRAKVVVEVEVEEEYHRWKVGVAVEVGFLRSMVGVEVEVEGHQQTVERV